MSMRAVASKLLGAKACGIDKRGRKVCIYSNVRGDGDVFVKVTVDGEVVARVAVHPAELLKLAMVAVTARMLSEEEREYLWEIVKRRRRGDDGRGATGSRARGAGRRRHEEEEPAEEEDEEEALELL